jgi:hypothetical protein
MTTFKDVEWVLTQVVAGREVSNATQVRSVEAENVVYVSVFCAGGGRFKLMFNNEFVDVGEQLTDYLGVLDELAESGYSAPASRKEKK